MPPSKVPSAFTAMVLRGHQDNWCWKIFCGTCGHSYYKRALLEVGNGMHPEDSDFWCNQKDERQTWWPDDREFTPAIQERILVEATRADVHLLFTTCGSTFTLASVGLVLYHCERAERRHRLLSPVLSAVFRYRLASAGMDPEQREQLLRTERGIWHWRDLERLERVFCRDERRGLL